MFDIARTNSCDNNIKCVLKLTKYIYFSKLNAVIENSINKRRD